MPTIAVILLAQCVAFLIGFWIDPARVAAARWGIFDVILGCLAFDGCIVMLEFLIGSAGAPHFLSNRKGISTPLWLGLTVAACIFLLLWRPESALATFYSLVLITVPLSIVFIVKLWRKGTSHFS